MHIVIIGGGQVGERLAQLLADEKHDVYVIEADQKVARELEDRLDVQVIPGTGISRAVQFKAGINKADLLLAVTHNDEINLIAAMTAERIAKDCKTIVRVRDQRFLTGTDVLKAGEYGVDQLVSPEQAVADEVISVLEYDGPGQVSSVAEGKVVLLEFPVQPHSALAFASVDELNAELPAHSRIVAGLSGDELKIVDGADRFQVNERAIVLSIPGEVNDVLRLGGSDPHHVQRVLLIGGGDTGFSVAAALLRLKYDVTLVERDMERATEIATHLEKCTVIQGDGTQPDELAEQIRDGHEAVVSLVDDDAKSMLAAITAKHHGARKVVARVTNQDYGSIARKMGIDSLISPQRATANVILHLARRSHTVSTTMIGSHGELIDFQLDDQTPKKLLDRPIGEIKLPEGAQIGLVLREDEVLVPNPETTQLTAGDHVFIVCVRASVSKVEDLFG